MNHGLFFELIPAFAAGFKYNLITATASMAAGCILGYALALLLESRYQLLNWLALALRSLFCNVPSFVMLFYLTMLIPPEISINGATMPFPPLIKGIIALAIPVIGFSSGYFVKQNTPGNRFAAFKQYFFIILMASTTTSVIGVSELLATANTLIAARGQTDIMLPIYAYVCLWFIGTGLIIHLLCSLAESVWQKCRPAPSRKSIVEEGDGENNI